MKSTVRFVFEPARRYIDILLKCESPYTWIDLVILYIEFGDASCVIYVFLRLSYVQDYYATLGDLTLIPLSNM
jgi:hypothetical protein